MRSARWFPLRQPPAQCWDVCLAKSFVLAPEKWLSYKSSVTFSLYKLKQRSELKYLNEEVEKESFLGGSTFPEESTHPNCAVTCESPHTGFQAKCDLTLFRGQPSATSLRKWDGMLLGSLWNWSALVLWLTHPSFESLLEQGAEESHS